MHRVKFVVKNVETTHPEYRLISDRAEDFANFQSAMEFVRNIRARLSGKEELIGKPAIEDVK